MFVYEVYERVETKYRYNRRCPIFLAMSEEAHGEASRNPLIEMTK